MIALVLIVLLLIAGLAVVVYLLGFQLGGSEHQEDLLRTRLEAADVQRRLHDLTRDAMTAMVDHVERRQQGR